MAIGPLGSEGPSGFQSETKPSKNGEQKERAAIIGGSPAGADIGRPAAGAGDLIRPSADRLDLSSSSASDSGEYQPATYSLEDIRSQGARLPWSGSGSPSGKATEATATLGKAVDLEEVQRRIKGGFYDRQDVIGRIAEKIAEEMDRVSGDDT